MRAALAFNGLILSRWAWKARQWGVWVRENIALPWSFGTFQESKVFRFPTSTTIIPTILMMNCFCEWLTCKKVQNLISNRYRSTLWRCSVKKGVLKNFANFTEKHMCWSLILLKRDTNTGAFLWNLQSFQ